MLLILKATRLYNERVEGGRCAERRAVRRVEIKDIIAPGIPEGGLLEWSGAVARGRAQRAGTARRRAACPEEQETGKGGEPDADTLQGFRQRPRQARAAVQARAEAYTGILETVEKPGSTCWSAPAGSPRPGWAGSRRSCVRPSSKVPRKGGGSCEVAGSGGDLRAPGADAQRERP